MAASLGVHIAAASAMELTAIGLALIAVAATSTIGLWGYLGIVPLLTGLMGWCPPYAMFGFNTCSLKK